jgi:GT2 family glycosyltransferase
MIDGSFREAFHAIAAFAQQTFDDFELIWVEYYGSVDPQVTAAIASAAPRGRVLTLGQGDVYHSSHCFNAGISSARGELILIPDGDLVVQPDFVERMWLLHERNPRLVTYNYRYNEPKDSHRDGIDIAHLQRVGVLTHPSNWGGCLGVRRHWLLEVNGYEQHPVFATGDHGNDFDMYVRLKNLGLEVCWPREPVLYHPWHPGTLAFAYTHRLQALMTQDRAHRLTTVAYQGIDSTRDSTPPAALLDAIEEARRGFEEHGAGYQMAPAARFGA